MSKDNTPLVYECDGIYKVGCPRHGLTKAIGTNTDVKSVLMKKRRD